MNFLEFFNQHDRYEDHEVAQFYVTNPSMKIADMAKRVGRSIPELYRILQRHGHQPNRLNTKKQMVLDFSRSGYSLKQIADLTGYTIRNVRYILDSEGKNDSKN
jgi:hypothetical protein